MAGSRCAVFGRVNHESRVTAARHARNADDDIGGDRGNRIGKQSTTTTTLLRYWWYWWILACRFRILLGGHYDFADIIEHIHLDGWCDQSDFCWFWICMSRLSANYWRRSLIWLAWRVMWCDLAWFDWFTVSNMPLWATSGYFWQVSPSQWWLPLIKY